MPDFLILGAMKSGTTSLYNYLTQHPRILPAKEKEIHFFDRRYGKGLGWYKKQFRPKALRKLGGKKTGEATPAYLFYPSVPRRVFEKCSWVKLVCIIRDPVDRAYSHYWHAVRLGYEKLEFEAAIDAEQERLAAPDRIVSLRWHSYLTRGIYVDQIKRWREYFPKERIHVMEFENFKVDTAAAVSAAMEFLGLKPCEVQTDKIYNSGGEYPPMKLETRERLEEFFAPYNRELSDYLGVGLPWGGLER
ncbi:MAG: sulfotransferase domain-containing protein [Nitrospirota bacterium]